jgi:hypothetical protein
MPEYERCAADAAALGQIGRAIFPQPTSIRVRLPRALADLAAAAWARDEDDEQNAAPREEAAEQTTARHQAERLALIGLSIDRAGGGMPAGDDVLVDLEASNTGCGFDAAGAPCFASLRTRRGSASRADCVPAGRERNSQLPPERPCVAGRHATLVPHRRVNDAHPRLLTHNRRCR